jgi:hypothetical protein
LRPKSSVSYNHEECTVRRSAPTLKSETSVVQNLYVSDHPKSATPTAENEGFTRLAI